MCTFLWRRYPFRRRRRGRTIRLARKSAGGFRRSRKWQRPRGRFVRRDSTARSPAARGRGCHGWLGILLLWTLFLERVLGFALRKWRGASGEWRAGHELSADGGQHALQFIDFLQRRLDIRFRAKAKFDAEQQLRFEFGQIAISIGQLLKKIARFVPCLALGNTRWNGHRRPADQRRQPKTLVGRKPLRQLISELR